MKLGYAQFPLLFLGSLFFLAGCETGMNAAECVDANWEQLGYQDGAAGRTRDKQFERQNDCDKYAITLNFDAYNAGRSKGLEQYCVPTQGYDLGANGSDYNGLCKGFDEAGFLTAFDRGRELYSYTSRVDAAERRLNRARDEIIRLENKISDFRYNYDEADGYRGDKTQRRNHFRRIHELEDEIYDAERDVFDLEVDLRVAQERLAAYRLRTAVPPSFPTGPIY